MTRPASEAGYKEGLRRQAARFRLARTSTGNLSRCRSAVGDEAAALGGCRPRHSGAASGYVQWSKWCFHSS